MKWLYYVAFIFFSLISTLKTVAQDEFDYNIETMNWIFVRDSKLMVPSYYSRDTLHFFFEGDTIINEIPFYRLKCNGVYYPENDFTTHYFTCYYNYYRFDTVNKLVVMFDIEHSQEVQIMNYDLEINSISELYSGSAQVADIDTLEYCNIEFKKYLFEGGGYIKDILSMLDYDIFEFNSDTGFCLINCFYISDNENCELCEMPTNVSINQFVALKVYPNPSSGFLYIDGIKEFNGNEISIEIFDYSGKKMRMKNEAFEDKLMIDLSSFSNGIYIININNEGTKLLTTKFIINR